MKCIVLLIMHLTEYTVAILALLFLLAIPGMADESVARFPLEAYGVWDRGSSFSFIDYPFLKGLTFNADWEEKKPWYQLNLPLNFYWGAVNAIHGGQSVWDISASAMRIAKEEGCLPAFYFFNKYAGQIYPASAADAFCALHKGLDAADTVAYPEATYGKAEPNNVERMLKICHSFAQYGARVDDEDALRMGQVRQRRSQTGFNDVGWQIWPDNYSRFLRQIDADETSIPRWRIGGEITPQSAIYARFARGFEHASGKDGLHFKLR